MKTALPITTSFNLLYDICIALDLMPIQSAFNHIKINSVLKKCVGVGDVCSPKVLEFRAAFVILKEADVLMKEPNNY